MTPEQEALLREADEYWRTVRTYTVGSGDDLLLRLLIALRAALADAERLDWVLPIVTGDDDAVTNARTLALGAQLILGKDGRAAIDAARVGKESSHQYVRRVTTDAGGHQD